jgi:hypothetical protein
LRWLGRQLPVELRRELEAGQQAPGLLEVLAEGLDDLLLGRFVQRLGHHPQG